MNLSEHFTLEELTASETAARLAINNVPTVVVMGRLKLLAATLEEVRAHLGHPLLITSGYRSPALNAKVPGSSDTSAHTLGWAADFKCPGFGPPMAVCRALSASGIRFDQIILEYATWTHISIDPRLRGEVLTKRANHPYERGLVA